MNRNSVVAMVAMVTLLASQGSCQGSPNATAPPTPSQLPVPQATTNPQTGLDCVIGNATGTPWTTEQCAAPVPGNQPHFSVVVKHAAGFPFLIDNYELMAEALQSYLCGQVIIRTTAVTTPDNGTAIVHYRATCEYITTDPLRGWEPMTDAQCQGLLEHVNAFRCYAMFAQQSADEQLDAALAAALERIPEYLIVRRILMSMGSEGVSNSLLPVVEEPLPIPDPSNTSAANCTPQLAPPCVHVNTPSDVASHPSLTLRFERIDKVSGTGLLAIGLELERYFCGVNVSLFLEVDDAATGDELLLVRASCNPSDCPPVHEMMWQMRCGVQTTVFGRVADPAYNALLQPLLADLNVIAVSAVGNPEPFATAAPIDTAVKEDESLDPHEKAIIVLAVLLTSIGGTALFVYLIRRERLKDGRQRLNQQADHAPGESRAVNFSSPAPGASYEMRDLDGESEVPSAREPEYSDREALATSTDRPDERPSPNAKASPPPASLSRQSASPENLRELGQDAGVTRDMQDVDYAETATDDEPEMSPAEHDV